MSVVAGLIVFLPLVAHAEYRSGEERRASGFALEVGLGATNALYVDAFGLLIPTGAWSLSPQLQLGGQIGRIGFGMEMSINFSKVSDDDDSTDDFSVFIARFGPYVDGEIWSHRRAALFLSGSITPVLVRYENDFEANGMGLDLALGGRFYAGRQLSVGVKMGTRVDLLWWSFDEEPPITESDENSVSFGIYGAFFMRFVAGS